MTDNSFGARGKRLLPGQSVNLAQSGGRRLQPAPLFWRKPCAPILLLGAGWSLRPTNMYTLALLLLGGAIGV